MIYTLSGKITYCDPLRIVIEVGGIGFGILVAVPEQYTIGDTVSLFTVMQWNQETGPHLFGFSSQADRELFILVTGCSGMGPKLALSLLQNSSVEHVASALIRGDHSYLSSLKGIGPKKAEALVMQLRNKVEHLLVSDKSSASKGTDLRDVSDALHALRYSAVEVASAIEVIRQTELLNNAPFDQLMRRALSHLARPGR